MCILLVASWTAHGQRDPDMDVGANTARQCAMSYQGYGYGKYGGIYQSGNDERYQCLGVDHS
jgi:hypothetical protein